MEHPAANEARSIGFNESVSLDGRVVHVQTEVLGHEKPVIRTTILEGGLVLHVENHGCPTEPLQLEQLRQRVEQQHRHHVQQVAETLRRGSH